MSKLEDIYTGSLDLTAPELAYLHHALTELYMRGGWCPKGENRRAFTNRIREKLGTLKLDRMVTPDGSRLVSVAAHAATFEGESMLCPHCQAGEPSVWDGILSHYAHPVGSKLKMCHNPWRERCRRCSADVANVADGAQPGERVCGAATCAKEA